MKTRCFRKFHTFKKFTGLIEDNEVLEKLGLKPDDDYGQFETDRLAELRKFCNENPEYHIITYTSDCDAWDADKYFVTTIDNSERFVNRLHFFIGNGSKAPAFLAEVEKRDEDGCI